jgi:parallel beta-helix repeat protein
VEKKRFFIAVFISMLLFPVLAGVQFIETSRAETITVQDDYSTIQDAINAAADGDSVFVRRGTYNEVLVIDKALSLKGEDKEATVINGDNTATVILIRHDNVEVTGFTVIYDETPNTPKSYWMWSTRLIGIHLLSVKNCNIFGNKVSDCGAGIWLYDAHQNSITDNHVVRNDYGIRVEASTENNLSGNTVTGNWGGLWLISASNNKFKDNSMTNNVRNFGISSDQLSAYLNDADTSNTADGRPIYYWVDVSYRTVPSGAGCVVLVNCRNITVQGLSLSKVQDAIILVNTWNSIVTNNIITECYGGIKLFRSINDEIIGNNINSPLGIDAGGDGIRIISNRITGLYTGIIVNGNYQTITDNTLEAGVGSGNKIIECKGSYNNISRNRYIRRNELEGRSCTGTLLEGSYNVFYENTITNGDQIWVEGYANIIAKNTLPYGGISVSSGSNNIVCGNRMTNGYRLGVGGHNNQFYANHVENSGIGVAISGTKAHSSNNMIYHNNFINNRQQVKNLGANSANFWDNGSEGNYWSDYNGSDLNMDGIGDTPHLIRSKTFDENLRKMVEVVSGQDNYPLMAPFDISSVNVELPEWEYTPPSPSPLPSPSPEPTPFPSPSSLPAQEPTSTPEQQPEPFSTTLVVAVSGASVAIIGVGLLVYFKKRKR